jgi:phosphatidylinositol alpha-mannosyltransferase
VRIALTTPTNWPEVRRGAERMLNELAAYMAARGHEVTVLSARPGGRRVTEARGYRTISYRRLWHPALARAGVHEFHAFAANLLPGLLWHRFDVILAGTFLDAYVASWTRRLTGTPCVLLVNSPPPVVRYVRSITLGGAVYRRAVRSADEVLAVSRYMQECLGDRFGRQGCHLPVPVDVDRFPLSTARELRRPVVLCASALDDRRKGGRVLMAAFDRLKRRRPDAVLEVCAPVSAETRAALLPLVDARWHADVHFTGAGPIEDLPARFGRAAVVVLPSMSEAFGMVVLEAMACGTPVVGTRHGALPELIDSDEVGRLFDPGADAGVEVEATNADGLADALAGALELGARPETAARCRAQAEQYSWQRVGPRYEDLFARLAAARVAAEPARADAP